MANSRSSTVQEFFGGSRDAEHGNALRGLLNKVLPIRSGEREGPEDQFAS